MVILQQDLDRYLEWKQKAEEELSKRIRIDAPPIKIVFDEYEKHFEKGRV